MRNLVDRENFLAIEPRSGLQGPLLGIAAVLLLALSGGSCQKSQKSSSPELGDAATGGAGPAAAPREAEPAESRIAAERELAEQIDLVRRTGPSTPELETSFASVLSQLRERLRSSTHARFLDDGCFRGGCMFTMQFPQQVAHEAIDTALLQDEAFTRWPGGKFRSGVFSADAKTAKVTWILFLDDVPIPPAPAPAGR